LRLLAVVLALGSVGAAWSAAATPTEQPELVVFAGAGDISSCYNDNDEATARLLDDIDGEVFALGDTVYDYGSAGEYASCYDPTWGRHRDRTWPVAGNHEYRTPGADGYFDYFGARAGDPATGWYSFDLGAWHIVALNSNCGEIGGCGEGSAQLAWLRADLSASEARCTLAMTHHPRFSSGGHGNDEEMTAIWQALYDDGAEVLLSGHDHTYERFAPQDPSGSADPAGVVQFVVGTGGGSLRDFEQVMPNSGARNNEVFGVLMLTLHPDGYDWAFLPVKGESYTDTGSAACH
jgi:hypothetical protein